MDDFARAASLFAESLGLYRELDDPWGAAGALSNLALATRGRGDVAAAIAMFAESVQLFRETGDARNTAYALIGLADTEKLTADLDASAEHYREAIAGFDAVDDAPGVADGLAGLAGVLVRQGDAETAARILAAATTSLPAEPAHTLAASPSYRADTAAMRAALGDDRFAEAWASGQLLSLDAAVAAANDGAGQRR